MKKGKIITIISVSILCLSLFSTLVFSEGFASRLCEVITLVTAVIGAVALYLQFRRDKEINEANFLVEYWKIFTENDSLLDIEMKCEYDLKNKKTAFNEGDSKSIALYAQWLESLSAIINREMLSFDFIDNMYNYLFFVFVNNKYIQQTELLPNWEYYQGIIKTYDKWVKYLKKHNKKIIMEENGLDKALASYNHKIKK